MGYGFFENPGVLSPVSIDSPTKTQQAFQRFPSSLRSRPPVSREKTEAAGLQGSKSEIPKPLSRARL